MSRVQAAEDALADTLLKLNQQVINRHYQMRADLWKLAGELSAKTSFTREAERVTLDVANRLQELLDDDTKRERESQ